MLQFYEGGLQQWTGLGKVRGSIKNKWQHQMRAVKVNKRTLLAFASGIMEEFVVLSIVVSFEVPQSSS